MSIQETARLVLVACVAAASGSAADPVVGTWELDVEQSSYQPGPGPVSETRIYEATPEGVKVTIRSTRANGETTVIEHPANFDGKDYPLTGSNRISAISLTKIDDYRSQAVLKHGKLLIGTAKRTVAEDGKTMRVIYQGTDAAGRKVRNSAVYVKQ